MKQFFQFVVNHWLLWSALVLLIIVIVFEEIRGRVLGIARVQPQDLTRMINRDEGIVIDVRDSNAFAKGHIINSINIPHTAIDANLEKLTKYKDKAIVIVGTHSQTGAQEGAKLKQKGYEKVYFLSGGLAAWQDAGLPLTRD